MITIGKKADFMNSPEKVIIAETTYFLVLKEGQYKLLSSVCPHQAGKIHLHDDCFKCEIHQWVFDFEGQSKNIKSMQMEQYDVIEQQGYLYVDFQEKEALIEKRKKTNVFPTIKLHSHACIEVELEDFRLICDPWLEGNAFLGAWIPYPAPIVTVADLQPDAIWISHEHSDHFHEPTLRKFNKSIPVYVPHFPNERMEQKLKKLGFQTVITVPFGEKVQLADHFYITTYEPASLWNDALVLIEAGDFRLLNLNDTGINRAIAKKIGKVDMVASSFSPGASGYPLTWTHLTEDEKRNNMSNAKTGMLKMIDQSMELYGASYFLPCASYFSLWHESHYSYIDLMQKNTLFDVLHYFKDAEFKVIDLLPGDSWDAKENIFTKQPRHERIFEKDYVMQYIKERDFGTAYEKAAPPFHSVTVEEMSAYILQLNDIPEMIFCEDVTVQINAIGTDIKTVNFEVKRGRLSLVEPISNPNITFNVPTHILHYVIKENESWDEPIIGYWCQFSRNPDVYHADFWRLLQAPYYKKVIPSIGDDQGAEITLHSNVATTLERHGELAARIFGRYGLHCIACQYAPFENIGIAAKIHGLSTEKQQRLIKELNRCLIEVGTNR